MVKLSKTTLFVAIVCSLVVFLISMRIYGSFLSLMLPKITGVSYQANSVTRQFSMSLMFSLTFAAIPITTILLWKQLKIRSNTRRILVAVVLICTIALAGLIRHYKFSADIRKYAGETQWLNDRPNENIQTSVSLDRLEIEKYMLVGLFAGIVILYLTMQEKNQSGKNDVVQIHSLHK